MKRDILLVVSGIILTVFLANLIFSITTFVYLKRVDTGAAKIFNGLNQANQNIAQRLVVIENIIKPATQK